MDIVDLREFYASRLGSVTRRLIASQLVPRLRGLSGARVMGLGFSTPYLEICGQETEAQIAFMMARQGVMHWPAGGAVQSALVDECDLPLLESAMDLALVVHGLELSQSPGEMLKEVWRVLAPQGRLVLVIPNRRGLWARFDTSPFGYGQPFSRPQLSGLLRESQFSVLSWSNALYFPPTPNGLVLSAAPAMEGVGSRLMPAVSGVIIVEAIKQVYAMASGKKVRRLAPQLRPALAPATSQRAPMDDP